MWDTNHGLMNFHFPVFFSTKSLNHKLSLGFAVVLSLIYSMLKSYSSTRWRGACLRVDWEATTAPCSLKRGYAAKQHFPCNENAFSNVCPHLGLIQARVLYISAKHLIRWGHYHGISPTSAVLNCAKNTSVAIWKRKSLNYLLKS